MGEKIGVFFMWFVIFCYVLVLVFLLWLFLTRFGFAGWRCLTIVSQHIQIGGAAIFFATKPPVGHLKNGVLVSESSQIPMSSGLGIILIWPESLLKCGR